MRLRDEIESVLRAWNAYEIHHGCSAVIDFDCYPTDEQVAPAESRLEVYRRLRDLSKDAAGDSLSVQLDAHIAYLSAVLGERLPLDEYLKATQGCAGAGWSDTYVSERGELARERLNDVGVVWGKNTENELQEREGILTPELASDAIRHATSELEPIVRKTIGTTAPYRLTVETVTVNAYWSYWLDSVGQNIRLRLNTKGARFTTVRARQFALHEVLGHGLQSASLAAHCRQEDVTWVRLTSVHAPYQVMFEGLAQALPLFVIPDDAEVITRVRLDHYLQLVRAELHLAINSGHDIATCARHARLRVPWWTDEVIADELRDRGTNPQLRSYLWSYPAGLDWFAALANSQPADLGRAILHAAYRNPLTPAELTARWPAGPPVGGAGGTLRLRDPALSRGAANPPGSRAH